MEYAWRDDLACIALAAGDSDFSPLFRRLREMGKQVVGIGPRSALSESVKSSCSRFFYTQTEKASTHQDEVSRASAFDDAADLLEKALKTFDGSANCSALKNLMLNLDSAFDEKSMGFKSFTAFVKAVDGIELRQDDNTWCAIFADNEPAIEVPPQQSHTAEPNHQTIDSAEGYRRILRKKHWRSLPTAVLSQCYQEMQKISPIPKSELLETTVASCGGDVTTADVNKAAALLLKAGFLKRSNADEDEEYLWQVSTKPVAEMLYFVDQAMVVRLLVGLDEIHSPLVREYLPPLFLVQHTDQEIDQLIQEAKQMNRNGSGQE